MLAALEALKTLDLLQVRHEDGIRRIARQLGTDVERLPGDQRDALAADVVRSGDAMQHRPQFDTTVAGTTTERITRYAKHAVMTVIRKETAAKAAAA